MSPITLNRSFSHLSKVANLSEVLSKSSEVSEPIYNGRRVQIDRAMHFIEKGNPRVSPGMARTWIDVQGRSEAIAIYQAWAFHPLNSSMLAQRYT